MINQATGLVSDQDIIGTIAEVIADEASECHRYGNGCQLGYVGSPTGEKILAALREVCAVLSLDELRSNRVALVSLPKPDLGVHDNGHRPRHWEWNVSPGAGDFAGTDVHAYSDGVIDVVYESNELTPDVARRLAAALLAAADEAEEGK